MEEKKKEYIKPDEDNLGVLLWRIMRLWQRERQRDLDQFHTTVSQMEILGGIYYLNAINGEVTQIFLSQETGIDPMTTSTILRNLEKKGYVSRRPSKMDTRARIVETTEAGNELLFAAMQKMRESTNTILEDINDKLITSELKKLLKQLEKQQNI